MAKLWLWLGCLSLGVRLMAAEVLMVADEFLAMQVLGARLQSAVGVKSRIVAQTNMPADLAAFPVVLVYIHGRLLESAETRLIDYTERGGKLIALHHSISSGKSKNRFWFTFLGVRLPEGDVSHGGYKWIEGVTLELVNLAPGHFITTNQLTYPTQVPWRNGDRSGREQLLPGFTLRHSEVYLNHVLTSPRTILLGFKYADPGSGQYYEQQHAGWVKSAGQGWIVYLMPGHSARDFEDATYGRLVVNAVAWMPPAHR